MKVGSILSLGYFGRSISAKIQCSILHCTLHNLSYILCLSLKFALAIQFFCIQHSTSIYATFQFLLSTFNFFIINSQVFEFDLQVQWNVHSFFRIQHLSFKFSLPTSDFGHCTCKFPYSTFNFSNWTFTRWSATDGDRGLNWPNPPPLKWWSRVGRETFQWSGLGRPSPLPTNQTSTIDRTSPIAWMPLHSLRVGRWVLSNRLSSLVERCISWKIS